MHAQAGIDAVILGGTELPLVLREPDYAGVPVLDSTGVHVEAALDWMLGETAPGDVQDSRGADLLPPR